MRRACPAKGCLFRVSLDVAQRDDIPHVAACGGKGVCSTCRVEVLEGLDCLSPRTEAEAAIAVRRGWPDHVRLACEARLMGAGPPPGETGGAGEDSTLGGVVCRYAQLYADHGGKPSL